MPTHHGRSVSFARRAPQRRKLVWATFDSNIVGLTTTSQHNVNLLAALSVAGSSLLGITIIRTHLRFTWTHAAAGDGFTVGLLVGRLVDVGTPSGGSASATNQELDWMLLDARRAVTQGGGAGVQEYTYDIRAKRKMEELNQAYLLCFSGRNAGATDGAPNVWARTLVALP